MKLLKVTNPFTILGGVTIFVLMLFCLYGSFLLHLQSSNVEKMLPSDENLMLTSLSNIQENMLGLLTITAFLSIIGPLFVIHVERAFADKLISWKEKARGALAGILLFQPVMLFWLNTPNGLVSRAIAMVRYNPIESISLASNVKTFTLMFIPIWTFIIIIFVLSFLKILKAL